MTRRLPTSSAAKQYTLQLTGDIARKLQRCRASLRQSIEKKLQEITAAASASASPVQAAGAEGPPLRFYVSEGYRVSYVIRRAGRTVAVLDIRNEPG
jgi:hypothetical protein